MYVHVSNRLQDKITTKIGNKSFERVEQFKKGCMKCCISSAVDETDDGMLWNGNVKSECEEDEANS